MDSLHGKVMLVTGGAHRVGKAIALTLAREGAEICFTYHTSAEEAVQTQNEISIMKVEALAIRCDQTDLHQIENVILEIKNRFGRLDGLVNCASIMQEIPLMDVTPEIWDNTLSINTRGPFFLSQAAARLMLDGESKGGAILNILDESAVVPTKYFVHHSASKAALHMLTQSMALALAPNIRVNAVLPGPVLMPENADVEKWGRLEKNTPLKRFGTPEDVARAVVYLMKEEYITGHVLVVDGGRTIR